MPKENYRKLIMQGFKWSDCRFIRIYDMNLIPKPLMEQIDGDDLNIDLLYAAGESMLTNPYNLMYAIANAENIVVGCMWLYINPLEFSLNGRVLTIEKKKQNKGIMKFVIKRLIEIRDHLGLKKLKIVTTRPKALERYGFKKSKGVLMEV